LLHVFFFFFFFRDARLMILPPRADASVTSAPFTPTPARHRRYAAPTRNAISMPPARLCAAPSVVWRKMVPLRVAAVGAARCVIRVDMSRGTALTHKDKAFRRGVRRARSAINAANTRRRVVSAS